MRYEIRYFPQVREDVRRLPPDIKRLVQASLDEISENPRAGTPLVRELTGLWKYRARRYRIIYQIHSEKRQIIVLLIDRRESVYDRVRQLLKL